jgi:hypothetical protein
MLLGGVGNGEYSKTPSVAVDVSVPLSVQEVQNHEKSRIIRKMIAKSLFMINLV